MAEEIQGLKKLSHLLSKHISAPSLVFWSVSPTIHILNLCFIWRRCSGSVHQNQPIWIKPTHQNGCRNWAAGRKHSSVLGVVGTMVDLGNSKKRLCWSLGWTVQEGGPFQFTLQSLSWLPGLGITICSFFEEIRLYISKQLQMWSLECCCLQRRQLSKAPYHHSQSHLAISCTHYFLLSNYLMFVLYVPVSTYVYAYALPVCRHCQKPEMVRRCGW